MIPKKIHYCWFGGNPLPDDAVKCIESWKKYLPDYEIRRWDESNYDVNKIPYTAEAYNAKKYAFVSDYARFDILYHYGGLYFDTDVEVIRDMDEIIAAGPFMGCENGATPNASADALGVAPGLGLGVNPGLGLGVNPGLGLGVNPGLGLYAEILDYYRNLHFVLPDGTYKETTIVTHTTNILVKHGLVNTSDIQQVCGVRVYPKEYFCPVDYNTRKLTITPNTRTIHHYTASWVDECGLLTNRLTQKLSFLPLPTARRIALFLATARTKGLSSAMNALTHWLKQTLFT